MSNSEKQKQAWADELDSFKDNLSMYDLATQRYGFTVDIEKTGRNNFKIERNIFMTNGRDKLLMSNKSPWMYWDASESIGRNGKIGGDIISFVQWQENCHIGVARRILREYAAKQGHSTQQRDLSLDSTGQGKHRSSSSKDKAPTNIEQKDLDLVRKTVGKLKPVETSDYLESRGLSHDTITNPLFHNRVLMGYNKAIIFPHWNEEGLCGFEFKNHEISGFSKNGYKGLWYSQIPKNVEFLIFVESGIEAMSHYQLHQPKNTAYFTPSGNWKKEVDELIAKVVSKYPKAQVITAFNHDNGGKRQSNKIENIVTPLKRSVVQTFPKTSGFDWNDQLKTEHQKKNERVKSVTLERKLTL